MDALSLGSLAPPAAQVTGRRDGHGLRQGWFRFFNPAGELIATAFYRDDLLHGQVITLQSGKRIAELSYRDGLADGPYRRCVVEGTYRTASAIWEEGCFASGLSCGIFRLRDAGGDVVVERDFGRPPIEDEGIGACLRNLATPGGTTAGACGGDDIATWFRYARALLQEQRVAEALAALARGIGVGGNPEVFRQVLSKVSAPTSEEEAERRASAIRASGSPRVLLASLLRGAAPSAVLRRLAIIARGDASASFLQAAVALHEWPLSPIVARALREVRSGSPESVLSDARTLSLTHPEEARLLGVLAARRLRSSQTDEIVERERTERPTIRRATMSAATT